MCWFSILASSALAGPTEAPVLTPPRSPPVAGDAISLGLTAPAIVWLDGCNALELERRAGGAWVPEPLRVCASTPPAIRIESSFTFTIPSLSPGEYRGVLAWGSGCIPDRPFTLAACESLGFVRSEPFTVSPAPPAPAPASPSEP